MQRKHGQLTSQQAANLRQQQTISIQLSLGCSSIEHGGNGGVGGVGGNGGNSKGGSEAAAAILPLPY